MTRELSPDEWAVRKAAVEACSLYNDFRRQIDVADDLDQLAAIEERMGAWELPDTYTVRLNRQWERRWAEMTRQWPAS